MSFPKSQFLLFIILIISTSLFANPPSSFAQAKKKAETIFKTHRSTLYCDCPYNEKKEIDLLSCQMQEAASRSKRATRVEYEHMLRRFSNML